MANEERKKEDLYIKEKKRSRNFFITSSAKMDERSGVNKTTISSSVFTKMSQSFSDGDYLLDDGIREINGSVLYMLQEMQSDLDDVYNEASASAFQASFFPFASMDSCSIGFVSSSLIPHKDNIHSLGKSGNEWKNLYVDGTAYIDSLDLNGTNINTTLNTKALKTDISGSFTALSASIATDINNAGGGTIDSVLKNGSTNAVQNDAIYDEFQTKLSLKGGAMAGLIQPVVQPVTAAPKLGVVDVSKTNIIEVNSKQTITITSMTSAFAGQEVTIMNIGAGAITITHTAKAAVDSFFIAGGKNLTIPTATAYKFIIGNNRQWLVIQ